jgi:azurin
VVIAVILFAITIVEFILIWEKAGIDDDLGLSKIPILIFLSAIKFAIVILFYMHLKFDNPFFLRVFLAGLALAFMVGLALIGLFAAMKGDARDFAKARAIPYEHHGEDAVAGSGETTAPPVGPLSINVKRNALEFDTASYTVASGDEVTLVFDNSSPVNQHNWVLVEPGTKDAVATDGTAAGAANDWVSPDDPRVIANTKLLEAETSGEVTFTAPAPGIYQFVCTFPGHNFTMFGDFTVLEAGAAPSLAPSTEAPTTAETAEEEPMAPGTSGPVSLAMNVQGEALEFDAVAFEVSSGASVTLTLNNPSVVNQHNWVLVEPGTKDAVATDGTAAGSDNGWVPPDDPRVIANTKLLGPGITGEVTFTAPAPGIYQFVCTFPGHNFTMFGDFVVK